MKTPLLPALALISCVVFGGCSGPRIYSADAVNDSDRTVRMEVREGKGAETDRTLAAVTTGNAGHLTWSGQGGENVYFRATLFEHEQPVGQPKDLALTEGGTTSIALQVLEGQLQFKTVSVRHPRSDRPEDIVPPPDRLRSGQIRR